MGIGGEGAGVLLASSAPQLLMSSGDAEQSTKPLGLTTLRLLVILIYMSQSSNEVKHLFLSLAAIYMS